MEETNKKLSKKLNKFIKKFYLSQILRGSAYSAFVLVVFFILFSLLEFYSNFNIMIRTVLFWLYVGFNFIIIIKFICIPLLSLFKIGKTLSYKMAAEIIGSHFSEIEDKLLNVLELQEMSQEDNSLINASIQQKIDSFRLIKFESAVNLKENLKYLKLLLIPFCVLFFFIVTGYSYVLTESSERILKHRTSFVPEAPFNFIILNKTLSSAPSEDFKLELGLEGVQIPKEIYIKIGERTHKLNRIKKNLYEYIFKVLDSDIEFSFMAAGYTSDTYVISVFKQPKVIGFTTTVSPPEYTKINEETIKNIGDLSVPIGSKIKWDFILKDTDSITMIFNKDLIKKGVGSKNIFEKKLFVDTRYKIIVENNNRTTDTLEFLIKIIPDQFPEILVEETRDSSSGLILFSGLIRDDYSNNKLMFTLSFYKKKERALIEKEIYIKKKDQEAFFYAFNIDSLIKTKINKVECYFSVWDNDKINGSKETRSQSFYYKKESDSLFAKNIENISEKIKSSFDETISDIKNLKQEIDLLKKTLIEKEDLSWEQREKARSILKKQSEIQKQIEKNHERSVTNSSKKNKTKSSLKEKEKKLNELMEKVLDEETKELLKEMTEMLEKIDKKEFKKMLDSLDDSNENLEKELDRELEIYKQLEFEQELEKTIQELEEALNMQKTIKETKKENTQEDLIEKQIDALKKIKSAEKRLEGLKTKNESLENKNNLPETEGKMKDIEEGMKKNSNSLKNKRKNKSQKIQEKIIEDIEQLKSILENLQSMSSTEQQEENIESLRSILENLITLSFDQEDLIKKTTETPKESSEFVEIIKEQNTLEKSSQIVKDSLFALSKRVVQIENIINKEIDEINKNMKTAVDQLAERKTDLASQKQQFVMTSVNNLALLLSEVLKQLQQDIADATPGEKQCKKPGKSSKKPSLSQIKEAQKRLNKQLKEGEKGKKGRSKKLMELAKKQEEIRRQLLEIRNESNKTEDKEVLDNLMKKMEKNEQDIVYDNISRESFKRQQEIITRLIQAEEAEKKQENENKRESAEWIYENKISGKNFKEYEKKKRLYMDVIKTDPIKYKSYYKNKVEKYFKILLEQKK